MPPTGQRYPLSLWPWTQGSLPHSLAQCHVFLGWKELSLAGFTHNQMPHTYAQACCQPLPNPPKTPQEAVDQSLLGRWMSTSSMRPALLSLKLRIWARFGRTTSPLGVNPRITVPDPTKISDSGFDYRADSPMLSHQRPAMPHNPRRYHTQYYVQLLERKCE